MGQSLRTSARFVIAGLVMGVTIGLVARFLALPEVQDVTGPVVVVMSVGFLILVPVSIGYATVRPVPNPSLRFAIFAPWGSSLLVIAGAMVFGWEGAICVLAAWPMIFFCASLGGLGARNEIARAKAVLPVVLLLPYAVMPFEARRTPPRRIVETVTETTIAAPADVVWRHVVSVDSIRSSEVKPALFTAMGFPRPIAATLSHPGIGGVRIATFDGGIRFVETETAWEPERRLGFTIHADSVPPETLDPHVTIGGPYFDVLTGTYILVPAGPHRVRLILRSQHRVSTEFNLYAGWWADRIMTSIQANILDILKARCEAAAAAASPPAR